MRTKTRFLIVGAGPTGLGAAYRLKELSQADFIVAEASDQPGGLARSYRDAAGFTWDIGGHVQFSHYDYFDEVMERAIPREQWLTHQRESWAWMRGRFVPYPVQNNIRHFPKEDLWNCLKGLLEISKRPSSSRPAHFKEWILASFGDGLAEVFMLPYNFKVWAYPAEQMSYQWIGERVATVDLKRVLGNILMELDDVSWGPNSTFQFPLNGGTGGIWLAVAKLVGWDRIRLKSPVVSIDPKARVARLGSGEEVEYERLLSTVPLDRLCSGMIHGIDPETRGLASRLRHSSTNIVGIGLHGAPPEKLRTKCWMYFPEDDCPFYRATVFSNYSPENVPAHGKHWSLMTETSESPHKPVDPAAIAEETIQGCLNTGMISSRNEIASVWTHRVDYGYPTPSLERDEILGKVLPALDALGVSSRGRFGAWKYEVSNQDHSFMEGVEWADWVVSGTPEVTVFDPARVNAQRPRMKRSA